jgi:hypothetical protein
MRLRVRGWLSSIAAGFPAEFAGQTGPVFPDGSWDVARERLHPAVARQIFSLALDRPSSGEIYYPDNLLGCNMAFRRDFLIRCGGFSTVLQSYDEAFVVWPAMNIGERFYFNRQMTARHRVDPKRLERKFIWKKYFCQGAALQCLLPILRLHGMKVTPWSMCWDWIRALGGLIVSCLIGDRKRQSAFFAGLIFWMGRWQSFFGGKGNYYESFRKNGNG